MATVDKDIAEKLIEKCKKQKRPRVYCIASYENLTFKKKCYSICYLRKNYNNLRWSSNTANIRILWESMKCNLDWLVERLDQLLEKHTTAEDDRKTAAQIKKHSSKK